MVNVSVNRLHCAAAFRPTPGHSDVNATGLSCFQTTHDLLQAALEGVPWALGLAQEAGWIILTRRWIRPRGGGGALLTILEPRSRAVPSRRCFPLDTAVAAVSGPCLLGTGEERAEVSAGCPLQAFAPARAHTRFRSRTCIVIATGLHWCFVGER